MLQLCVYIYYVYKEHVVTPSPTNPSIPTPTMLTHPRPPSPTLPTFHFHSPPTSTNPTFKIKHICPYLS